MQVLAQVMWLNKPQGDEIMFKIKRFISGAAVD